MQDFLRGIFQEKHDEIADRPGQDDAFLVSDHDVKNHWFPRREKETASFCMAVDGAWEKGDSFPVGNHVAGGVQITDLTEDIGSVGTVGENLEFQTPEVTVLLIEDKWFVFKQSEIYSIFFKRRDAWMGSGKGKHEFLITQRHEFKHAVAGFPRRDDGDVCHLVAR